MKILGDALSRPIIIITTALTIFGLLAVLSASSVMGARLPECGYNSLYFFERQFISLILGIGFLVGARYYIDLDRWRRYMSWPFVFVCILLAIAVLFCPSQNGAKRWISLGFFNIQVGEIAKIALICFWADFLARNRAKMGQISDIYRGDWSPLKRWLSEVKEDVKPFFYPMLLTGFLLFFIEAGHDMGTLVLILAIVCSMLYVGGATNRLVVKVVVAMLICVGPLIFMAGYRVERVRTWIDPLKYSETGGYQAVNSFMAIASGGVWGNGVPLSAQKYGFLPEQHTDFIYAVICEEIGFVGTMGLLALFALFCYCGFKLATRCKDPYRSLLAFGITCQISMQALINVAVVTGAVPNKGFPLPFVSYGGSSLCMTLFSVGILLNIADSYRRSGVVRLVTARSGRRINRGATLSSSSDSGISPISSGEWQAVVLSHVVHAEPKLPQPKVDAGWKRVIPLNMRTREQREQLRRMRRS